ncbi:uncharacterized protein AruCF_2690 [Achromobacter ruhlandii]|nr:uncharacterized protein AruCF_2690 [Achromobacter ruhlandii]
MDAASAYRRDGKGGHSGLSCVVGLRAWPQRVQYKRSG